jgi:hypothetical protein
VDDDDQEESDDEESTESAGVDESDDGSRMESNLRRSTRVTKPIIRLDPSAHVKGKQHVTWDEATLHVQMEKRHNIETTETTKTIEYEDYMAPIAVNIMAQLILKVSERGYASFAQQYILQKGLKKFGQAGRKAVMKELDQLDGRVCFEPIDVMKLTRSERKKAQEALIFLTEKRDGTIKARTVYNGAPTRAWHNKEETASPTATTESVFLTAVVDAEEERDVMTGDVPNAFIQAKMPEPKPGEDRVILKMTGVIVDLMVAVSPERYASFVVYENGVKTLYLVVLRGLYGMLIAAMLWYKRFRKELEEEQGFEFNPYDPCVANRMVNGKQQTVLFHVDDLKSSHVDPKVNDDFLDWLNSKYGNYGEVKATRGKIHDYLGMTLDYSEKGKVKIAMRDYVAKMVDEFPIKFEPDETAPTPHTDDLFTEGTTSQLDKKRAEEFHTAVAKGLFASKRARPDIQPVIAYLCTRVRNPNQDDWRKLLRLIQFLNGTRDDDLTLSADNLNVIKWYVDASFAVHPDFKSHTGAVMTYGQGAIQSISRKQKLNTRSSTESELVGVDDASTPILWTKLFVEAQGHQIDKNIVYQDNKSAILLEKNGKKSSSKRTRALNIRYFFIADQVEKGNVEIQYCSTDDMTADYMTKPLQGKKFMKFRNEIMGFRPRDSGSDRSVLDRTKTNGTGH